MKKITFLMLHLNYGGLEKQTINLINKLAEDENYNLEIISVYDLLNGRSFYDINPKVKIRFLANFGPDHKKIKTAKENKDIIKLIKFSVLGLKCLYYKSVKLKKVIEKLDTDVIFSTRIEFAKLIKRKDTLNISQEHSYITDEKYINEIRKSFNYIKYLVVMTNKAKQDYENYLSDSNDFSNVISIPNMIEKIDVSKTAEFESNQLISVGRLEEEKDFLTLIDVFSVVHEKNSKLKLKIVGEGREREKIENKVKALGLEEFVSLVGKLEYEKLNEELESSFAFILTSKCESFSLVLCEAMRVGLPTVSFNIDVGPREIIKNGENGILIENRNKEKMAEEILNLKENSEKWYAISKKSLEDVGQYYDINVIKKWKELFK